MESGLRFGLNLTSVTIESEGISSKPNMPLGIHFGLNFKIPLNKNFSIFSGFMLSSKGADYKIDTVDFSLTPAYIEIPVNTAFDFRFKTARISLFAGPYLACTIGGYEIVSGNKFKYLTFGAGRNKDLKYLDFGFNFGVMVNIKSMVFLAQYGLGLADISPAKDMIMRNKVIGISMIFSK